MKYTRPYCGKALTRRRVPYADYGVAEVVRMLKVESLRVFALTGASVTISDVPGVINARASARDLGSTEMRLASSVRYGARPPTQVIDSQVRRPLESAFVRAV